jgi:cell division protein FtsW
MFKRKKSPDSKVARPKYGNSNYSPIGRLQNTFATRRHKPDYFIFVISLILCAIGLVVVYSISPGLAATNNVSGGHFVSRQMIAIGLGLVAFAVCSFIPVSFWRNWRNVLAGLTLLAIVAVQLFGEEVNGATRWIQLGGLSFQVAELIKLALIVWLAAFLVDKMKNQEITNQTKTLRVLIVILAVLGLSVAVMQSDLGSMGVMFAILGLMAFTAGIPMKPIFLILAIVAVGTFAAIASSEYRRERVATFLNPAADCQDSGYQACQAQIAIGSGGLFGLGIGNGVQAYGYLPEAANDSIFAILAEKFGFLGISVVIGIYITLFSRLKKIIERTADPFSQLFVVGVLAWLSTQAIINIGAMVGLLPLKGITLPFISFGGTSILFAMAALGVVFQISRYTSFEPIRNLRTEVKNDHSANGRGVRRPYYAAAGRRA